MTIRRRLATSILFMLSFLIILGSLMMLAGPVISAAFRQSIDSMNGLNAIRQIRNNITRQRNSLNRYLLLDDNQELLSFEETARDLKADLQTLQPKPGEKVPAWRTELIQLVGQSQRDAEGVKELYAQGNKLKAHERAGDIYGPVLTRVEAMEKDRSTATVETYNRIQLLTKNIKTAVMVILLVALVICIGLFRTLYDAVMTPLEALRLGAEQFGKGKWDQRIDLQGTNEFTALAKSFNTMADNVRQLQSQAVHMDRMSAVGQLAGGVAHEINNPLTAVLGQAQILLARLPDTDPSYVHVSKIEQAALRCRKIVRGLLDFSRPGQAAFESVDVASVISATLDLCEADLKRSRINVERPPMKPLPMIEGNPSELQQVFLNLFNNAIHAMPRGGTLYLEFRSHSEPVSLVDRKAGTTKRAAGPWVEIRVRDTGVGIA
ncbi:MAG: HAMP domain-containing protein, partial [Elusimicrobia bacterium]|nr:HAMP domain-containing protein [Elusimicrobiota bacterium]